MQISLGSRALLHSSALFTLVVLSVEDFCALSFLSRFSLVFLPFSLFFFFSFFLLPSSCLCSDYSFPDLLVPSAIDPSSPPRGATTICLCSMIFFILYSVAPFKSSVVRTHGSEDHKLENPSVHRKLL